MKKNTINAVVLILLASIIAFFSLSYIFVPAQSFSEYENRVLQTAPRFTLEKLLDGTYTSQLHSYFSDQINLRPKMVEMKAIMELALGKNESNGVLLCKDGYLIETHSYSEENYKYLQNNLKKIEKLTQKLEEEGKSAISAIIPRKVDVLGDKLPPYYSTERNSDIWDQVGGNHISLLNSLFFAKARGNEVFYKTDHHWTANGAYTAYKELSSHLGYLAKSKQSFELETLSNEFYGTNYSTSGFFFAKPDVMLSPIIDESKYKTSIVDINKTFDGILDRSYLNKKDKYSAFLSGNNAHVKVYDISDPSKPTLLILKDSYSHSLVPYLLEHFNLELIDPRYYVGSIEEYIIENNIENVLFLFGLDTLASANLSIR